MIKRERALDLAKKAGMDEAKFFALLNKEENYTREMLDEELDNINGGLGNLPDIDGSMKTANKKC